MAGRWAPQRSDYDMGYASAEARMRAPAVGTRGWAKMGWWRAQGKRASTVGRMSRGEMGLGTILFFSIFGFQI
jgi:hypothetical protein